MKFPLRTALFLTSQNFKEYFLYKNRLENILKGIKSEDPKKAFYNIWRYLIDSSPHYFLIKDFVDKRIADCNVLSLIYHSCLPSNYKLRFYETNTHIFPILEEGTKVEITLPDGFGLERYYESGKVVGVRRVLASYLNKAGCKLCIEGDLKRGYNILNIALLIDPNYKKVKRNKKKLERLLEIL